MDIFSGKGKDGDGDVKEWDRIGGRECHERRHSTTVHCEVIQRYLKPVTNGPLPYIPQEDEHGHEVHEPESWQENVAVAVIHRSPLK